MVFLMLINRRRSLGASHGIFRIALIYIICDYNLYIRSVIFGAYKSIRLVQAGYLIDQNDLLSFNVFMIRYDGAIIGQAVSHVP